MILAFYRSSEDPNVFIVNDFQSPLQVIISDHLMLCAVIIVFILLLANTFYHNIRQRTLSSLELPSSLPVASGQSVYPLDGGSSNENQGRTSADIGNRVSSVIQSGLRKQKSHDPTRDLSIHLLEKFSLVTKFARDTTTQLFSENNGFGTVDKRWNNQPVHSYPEKLSNIAEEKHNEIRHSYSENDLLKDEEISNDIDVPADPLEVMIIFLL